MTLRRGQIIFILFSFWILAIVLPSVRFSPGDWEAIKQGLSGKQPSLEILFGFIFALGTILFLFLLGLFFWEARRREKKEDDPHEIYREPMPVPWPAYVFIVLLLIFVGGLLWWVQHPSTATQPSAVTRELSAPAKEQATQVPQPISPLDSSGPRRSEWKWLEYLLALGFLAGLSFLTWRGLRRRPSVDIPEMPDLSRIVARAVMDLEKGGELSDIVLRCYRDMCAILGRKVALRKEMTAREFAQRLQQAGVSEREVLRLTSLFERVRYGRHAASPDERAEAIALLQTIERRNREVVDET